MRSTRRRLVLCLHNQGYEVSLERGKFYATVPDSSARRHRQIRVIDESGEDYLYPVEYFTEIELPRTVRRVLQATV
jgi:hypothetical protein